VLVERLREAGPPAFYGGDTDSDSDVAFSRDGVLAFARDDAATHPGPELDRDFTEQERRHFFTGGQPGPTREG
jgi:hypothetical protein